MMTSSALPQQSMSSLRGNSLVAGTMERVSDLRDEIQYQTSVRPAVVLGTIFACLAAWGIAALFVLIG